MFVSITMIGRRRLLGGYQGTFVSITMIDRLRFLEGLSKYVRNYYNNGPRKYLGL